MCYTYHAHPRSEGEIFLRRLCARLCFPLAVLVLCVPLAFARRHVWRLEITGLENVSRIQVEQVLREQGIAPGKRADDFDAERLAAAVRRIDGVSLASVTRRGTTVRVEIFEGDRPAPPVSYSDVDICARYDATVTRIVTREGTPLVSTGQHVFAGTPLIGAHRTDAEGNEVPCRASGIVYGIVAYTVSRTVATEWIEYVPERTRVCTRLRLFGHTFGALPHGEGVQIVETRAKLAAVLPVTVLRAKVTTCRAAVRTATVEELAEKVKREAALSLTGTAISSFDFRTTTVPLGGGLYEVHVFAEGEAVIAGE